MSISPLKSGLINADACIDAQTVFVERKRTPANSEAAAGMVAKAVKLSFRREKGN